VVSSILLDRTGGFTVRSSHVEKAHASWFASSVNPLHDQSGQVPLVPVETEGCPDDFTSSEAILGLENWDNSSDETSFDVGMEVLKVVKMPSQGFAEPGVSAGLSDPACGGIDGCTFWVSAGVLTHGSGLFFPYLLTSFRVSMTGVRTRRSRRR
jgi:hypothetical protein